MSAIGTDGEILHAALGQDRDDAPGVAGHVGNHGRINRYLVAVPQYLGILDQSHKLLRPAQGGQLVAVEGVQADPAFFDGVDKGFSIRR